MELDLTHLHVVPGDLVVIRTEQADEAFTRAAEEAAKRLSCLILIAPPGTAVEQFSRPQLLRLLKEST